MSRLVEQHQLSCQLPPVKVVSLGRCQLREQHATSAFCRLTPRTGSVSRCAPCGELSATPISMLGLALVAIVRAPGQRHETPTGRSTVPVLPLGTRPVLRYDKFGTTVLCHKDIVYLSAQQESGARPERVSFSNSSCTQVYVWLQRIAQQARTDEHVH